MATNSLLTVGRVVKALQLHGYISYQAEAGTFDLDAPEEALTPEVWAFIDAHSGHVLRELRREHMTRDPRPDLETDSALWGSLLSMAYDQDGEDRSGLQQALHGFRCLGAALVVTDGKVGLTPGEWDAADYYTERTFRLAPHGEALVRLLDSLGGGKM